MSEVLSAKEAAEFLKINLYTLYFYSRKKLIPSIRIGNRLVRFDKGDLEEWLQKHKTKEAN